MGAKRRSKLSTDQKHLLDEIARRYVYPQHISVRCRGHCAPGRWRKRGLPELDEAADIFYADDLVGERAALKHRIYSRGLIGGTAKKLGIRIYGDARWSIDDLVQQLCVKLAGLLFRGGRIPAEEAEAVNYLVAAIRNVKIDVLKSNDAVRHGRDWKQIDLEMDCFDLDLKQHQSSEEVEAYYLETENDYLRPLKSTLSIGGVDDVEPFTPSLLEDDDDTETP